VHNSESTQIELSVYVERFSIIERPMGVFAWYALNQGMRYNSDFGYVETRVACLLFKARRLNFSRYFFVKHNLRMRLAACYSFAILHREPSQKLQFLQLPDVACTTCAQVPRLDTAADYLMPKSYSDHHDDGVVSRQKVADIGRLKFSRTIQLHHVLSNGQMAQARQLQPCQQSVSQQCNGSLVALLC
jgi:hypothetical protein